jgi:hypothetical protein
MSDVALERRGGAEVAPAPIASARELLPFVLFAGLILMLFIYFVGAEEGATSLVGGHDVHEWVHDARHLLGFPCH